MRKITNEATAWRTVAEYLESEDYGSTSIFGMKRLPALCHAVGDLVDQDRISYALYDRMVDRIHAHMALGPRYGYGTSAGTGGPFAFPMGDRDSRVLAALLLALECDDKQRAAA